jgi:DNA-binding response OmpR family regulator
MILLVEDNDTLANIYCRILITHGYEVHWCFEGQEGLDSLCRLHPAPDLIIADLALPDMDGVRFAELGRNQYLYTGPIMAISGALDIIKPECLRLFDTALPKPLMLKELVSSVQTLIGPGVVAAEAQ